MPGLQQLGADLKRSVLQDAQGLVGAQLSGLRVNQTHCLLAPFASGTATDPIPAGQTVIIPVPWNCTILEWTMVGNVGGSFDVTVSRGTQAGYPTVALISGANQPGLSWGAAIVTDAALADWVSRTLHKGDVLVITSSNVSSTPPVTAATFSLLLREG